MKRYVLIVSEWKPKEQKYNHMTVSVWEGHSFSEVENMFLAQYPKSLIYSITCET